MAVRRVKPKTILGLFKEALGEWLEDDAPTQGAALAFYTMFSLAPMLIIVIAVVSAVWAGQSASMQDRILEELQRVVGPDGAEAVRTMLDNTARPGSGGVLASVIGVAVLLFGATGVFAQLQNALNTIWNVRVRPGSDVWTWVRTRLLSFGMVLGIGFVMLVFLVVSAVLSALSEWVVGFTPGLEVVMQVVNFVVSFGVVTLLIAMMYRVLPDVEIAWRDVWMGAVFTALLFTVGKLGIGYYLGNTSAVSTYGAAGSLAVLLFWVFYSSQIIFFGAELTQVYAQRYGRRIEPSSHAYRVSVREVPVGPGAPPPSAPSPPALPPPALPARPAAAPRRSSPAWRRVGLLALVFFAGRMVGRRRS